MAEAFPENISDDGNAEDVNRQENPISVLLLATKWQFDTYGLSTVNKSLVNNLRVVDPEGKKIEVTCAVVEEEKNIKNDQKEDAEKYKVKLKGAKQPRGSKEKPDIKWLDSSAGAYYLDLVRENSFDFIIGHIPYLANGPLNLRDIYPKAERKPKVILMIHDLPRTTEGDTDEDTLLEWLSEADMVFSVGKEVEAEVFSSIASLPPKEKPTHKLYIPSYPLELFNIHRENVEGNKVRGTQNITMMTGNRKDLQAGGIDFPLAVASVSGALRHILEFDGLKTKFVMMTDIQEDKAEWRKEFKELTKGQEALEPALNFQSDSPENFEKLTSQLRKSNLMILPLKPGSPLFGSEALSAVAAGVPVLFSNHSGMAALLEMICQDQSVVKESVLQTNMNAWKEGILKKLLRPGDSQREANRLREQLLLDTNIAHTHLDFIGTIVETVCVRLDMDIDSDAVVGQEHIDMAVKFGVDLSSLNAPVEAKKYVLAFVQQLLLQREIIDHGHMKDYLESSVVPLWQDVLSTLENSNRKLLGVQSGSLIFTLFCPNIESMRELKDASWIKTLTVKMEQLVNKLGVQQCLLRIRPLNDVTFLSELTLLPRLRELKLRRTAQSEGYETMTQHSSDNMSEILQGHSKVMEWLKQQRDASTESQTEDTSALTLLEKINVNHIKLNQFNGFDKKFTISELSGAIGIASAKSKPTLSVMYPGTDKPPLILSRNDEYWSALFIPISGQEYLAAASGDEIRLWNLANNTSCLVYKYKKEQRRFMCLVDETTVASFAGDTLHDCFLNVHIFKTDTENWTLSSSHLVKGKHPSLDISYATTSDGTACLLRIDSTAHLVQSMELVGGKVRWQVDKQQMGEEFYPLSICTDGNTVFVTIFQDQLHLLSVDDGSVLTSIKLRPFGLRLPSCVPLQGDHLFVGHVNEKLDTYCISKFIKPTEV